MQIEKIKGRCDAKHVFLWVVCVFSWVEKKIVHIFQDLNGALYFGSGSSRVLRVLYYIEFSKS